MKKIVRSLWSNQGDQETVEHTVANSGTMPQSMALSIERIAELRKEIAQIQSSISPFPNQEREPMKQRRAERLREIMDELRALTESNKP
jgi:hypothetical protein